MRDRSPPHDYQREAIKFIIEHYSDGGRKQLLNPFLENDAISLDFAFLKVTQVSLRLENQQGASQLGIVSHKRIYLVSHFLMDHLGRI